MSMLKKTARTGEEQKDTERKENDSLIQPSCGICFMPITRNTKAVLQPCRHTFHFECVDKWLRIRRYCAYCRTIQPHVRFDFTSSIEFSTKFYDEETEDLEDEDLEILDYWGEEEDGEEDRDDGADQASGDAARQRNHQPQMTQDSHSHQT